MVICLLLRSHKEESWSDVYFVWRKRTSDQVTPNGSLVKCLLVRSPPTGGGGGRGGGGGVTLGVGSWGTNEHCNASALKSNAIFNYLEMHCNASALKRNVQSPNTLQHKVYSWSWKDVKGNFKIYPPKANLTYRPGSPTWNCKTISLINQQGCSCELVMFVWNQDSFVPRFRIHFVCESSFLQMWSWPGF